MIKFETIKVYVFDAYGTLFDVNAAVNANLFKLGKNAEQISMVWRQKQLEYSWLRSLMGQYTDFWHITQEALDFALDAYGIQNDSLKIQLLESYRHLDCYPEVPSVLKTLKQKGLTTAVLSNGSPDMLNDAIKSSKLDALIDVVLSVDDIRVYKPDPKVYGLVTEKFSSANKEILFHSANSWDIAGASSYGFQTAWINRFNKPKETLPFKPDIEVQSLMEVLKMIE